MGPRRVLLIVASVLSLTVLSYGTVILASSVPVTAESERANTAWDGQGPAAGERAFVSSVVDPAQVPTFAAGQEGAFGVPGALLAIAPRGANAYVPAAAEGVTFARALAFVGATANGSYTVVHHTFVGVPMPDADNTTANLTVDAMALGGGRTGFLVKGDGETEVRFVAREDVVGVVSAYQPASAIVLLLSVGTIGFVAPLVVLIVKARPPGPKGVVGVPGGALCPECRAPAPGGGGFCTRCGAWLRED